jgi:hypothetical protein
MSERVGRREEEGQAEGRGRGTSEKASQQGEERRGEGDERLRSLARSGNRAGQLVAPTKEIGSSVWHVQREEREEETRREGKGRGRCVRTCGHSDSRLDPIQTGQAIEGCGILSFCWSLIWSGYSRSTYIHGLRRGGGSWFGSSSPLVSGRAVSTR